MRKVLRSLADVQNERSLANRLRRKRFTLFTDLLETLPGKVTLLDVGGQEQFWENMGMSQSLDLEIAVLNIVPSGRTHPRIRSLTGDARNMPEFSDRQFDVVFSNSVIEHVGDLNDQLRMAEEVRRVGRRYFVQTPNRYFPVEPHFLFPLFGVLPMSWRTWLVQHFDLGWHHRVRDQDDARRVASSIRLLTRREITRLFPGGTIARERFLGITKSFIVFGGWDRHDGDA